MMAEKEADLEQRFEEAVERASNTGIIFPPDVKLYFYAYYKRALGAHFDKRFVESIDEGNLVNAFKMNALFQVKNISVDEAKKQYIALVDKHIPKG